AFDDEGQIVPGIVDDNPVYLFSQIDLFQEVGEQFHGHDYVARDRQQLQVALAIFRARPWHYAQWCLEAWRGAPGKVLWYNVVLLWLLGPLGLFAAGWVVLFLFRCAKDGPKAATASVASCSAGLRELTVMLVVALSLAVTQVLLIGAMVAFLP